MDYEEQPNLDEIALAQMNQEDSSPEPATTSPPSESSEATPQPSIKKEAETMASIRKERQGMDVSLEQFRNMTPDQQALVWKTIMDTKSDTTSILELVQPKEAGENVVEQLLLELIEMMQRSEKRSKQQTQVLKFLLDHSNASHTNQWRRMHHLLTELKERSILPKDLEDLPTSKRKPMPQIQDYLTEQGPTE